VVVTLSKRGKRLPTDHGHCWVCFKPIERDEDERFCSEDCEENYKDMEEQQRKSQRNRQLLSFIPVLVIIGYFVLRFAFPA
jgi:predicted nucleic acid-binding Zn ribbon protein